MRTESSNARKAWGEFESIKADSTNAHTVSHVTQADFDTLYDDLPGGPMSKPIADEDDILRMSKSLADLISLRAAWKGMTLFMGEVSAALGPSTSVCDGLEVFLKHLSRILNFSSGGVFLSKGNRLALASGLYPHSLDGELEFDLDKDAGIAVHVAKTKQVVLCGTRGEMAGVANESVPRSREARDVHSLMAAPILSDQGDSVGVLEVGSKRENAFSGDDLTLLKALAGFAGMIVKSARRLDLLQIVSKTQDLNELLGNIVTRAPDTLRGRGCSDFLRRSVQQPHRRPGGNAQDTATGGDNEPIYLVRTSEFPELEPASGLCYEPGEGLTGWVYKEGLPLRVPYNADGARTPRELKKAIRLLKLMYPSRHLQTPEWKGKGADIPGAQPKIRYEAMAFLAVPIMDAGAKCIGVIRIGTSNVSFTEEDENTLRLLGSAISSCLAQRKTREQLDQIFNWLPRVPKLLKASFRKQADGQIDFWTRFHRWALVPCGALVLLIGLASMFRGQSAWQTWTVLILFGAWIMGMGLLLPWIVNRSRPTDDPVLPDDTW